MAGSSHDAPALGGPIGIVSILIPAALFAWLCTQIGAVTQGPVLWTMDWVPSLGVEIGFLLDGLSLTFALLITGIGTLITLYSSSYLGYQAHYPRFVAYLLAFMVGMLGLVLSDNLLALFVFWEVTTISSYLLIGYLADDPKSRRNALQALLVTGTGGLAFLAGIILIAAAAGTFNISELPDLTQSLLYPGIFVLVVLGAFTKSAQVPFHFWLPNAMAAPTPVSAYLHSATMVKGGVYLLARMNPSMGGTDAWFWTLTVFGGVTAVFASVVALKQTDIKQVLAWTTLMALGTLVLFIGVGTPYAIEGMVVFLVVHAFYKAALFMVAGLIDHGTGTREVDRLRGLAGKMPFTFAAALLAGASMAGLPPLFGFIGKEFLYKGALESPGTLWVAGCAFAASALMFAAAGIVAFRPFTGPRSVPAETAHDGDAAMLAGPLLLAALGLGFGLFPDVTEPLLGAMAGAVLGEPVALDLYLYGGVNTALILSGATFAVGLVLYLLHGSIRRGLQTFGEGADPAWDRLMDGVAAGAKGLANFVQGGRLRVYVFVTFSTLAVMLAATLIRAGTLPDLFELEELRIKHWAVLIFIVAGAGLVAVTNSRMTAVASLGVVGVGVALVFIIFGAPDVAITQLLVEVLQVVLVAVAMLKLPHMKPENVKTVRGKDMILSLSIGAMVTLVALHVMATPLDLRITEYFEANSVPQAFGRNIVNVILVDFRALDTFGEIAVVLIAALGAYGLLRGTRYRGGSPR
ncbi:hydrogen gas-evolving membrane-bound hydrogenase subunit E [Jannaschia sp. LMIT008]|uniref:hydrogen gas-evolving membrane-bound hydrogenase subunit E n=1 Tax=Jannaschia maritima TaxID=3032585 RepID=UPI00281187FC|nr:hydrogen gas-evolving membrane-bound hydrogenase subunit E [Jannaschia sp. LMIT008]